MQRTFRSYREHEYRHFTLHFLIPTYFSLVQLAIVGLGLYLSNNSFKISKDIKSISSINYSLVLYANYITTPSAIFTLNNKEGEA